MNDTELLGLLADANQYQDDTSIPERIRVHDIALREIDRRIDMETQTTKKPSASEPTKSRGWLAAAAAFVIVIAVGVAVLLATGGGDDGSPASPVTTQATPVAGEDPESVLRAYEAARNSGDVDAVMALYAEDAVVVSHPLDATSPATGVLEIRGYEGQVPAIHGSTGGTEYTDLVVSGSTVTFVQTLINGDGECFSGSGNQVTVDGDKITLWVWGSSDPCE